MSIRTIIFAFLFVLSFIASSQSKGETKTYIKLYNNLYSQTANFTSDGSKVADTARRSFLNNILEINFYNKTKRTWWGIDAWFRASRAGDPGESPTKVLNYENNGLNAQTSFSHIGPKLNWRISENNKNLYLKVIALIPLDNGAVSEANIPALDNSGLQIWTQLNYSKQLADQWYGYAEFSFVSRFGRNAEPANDVFMPIKGFLSWYPSQLIGVFGFVDFTPIFSATNGFFFQPGGGIKLYPHEKLEIECSASKFVAGRYTGAGYSYNLGLNYRVN